jgi:DNA-binding beta-propeller fold protein YncE
MSDSVPDFSLVTTIQLPGTVGGHGDWVTYDPATHTVWLSQSPDNNVVVIDTKTNTVKTTISGVDNANGIGITPQYAFVADATNNVTDVIDKYTYQIVAKIPQTGTTPDSVTYVPATGEVYVASDDANVLDALSAQSPFAETASYPLTPSSTGPDVATYAKGLLYIPDGTQVDAVDPATGAILASPTLVSTGAVKPGVYDPVTDRFFFGTTNDQIEVVSGGSGAGKIGSVIGTIDIPGSTDEAAIDVRARLAFFGDKAGEVDVVSLDTMKIVATLPAETGMHTLTVDPHTHELYVYENNRNVVDVWKYGSDNSIAQIGSGWAHWGESSGMTFAASDNSGGSGADSGSGNTTITGTVVTGPVSNGSSDSSSNSQTIIENGSQNSGVMGMAQWTTQPTPSVLAGIVPNS